ncbi:hypothetical protein G6F22_017271 [Rhizopus arrhizus]|nr:hypothetical protein G6F22_017271 [Rhizopus arrhizus]
MLRLGLLARGCGSGTRGCGLRDQLAIDHRQAIAGRLVVHAHGLLGAVIAIGHVVALDHIGVAHGNAVTRLAGHAHGTGGAVLVAVGHVVTGNAARLGGGSLGVALALGAVDHAATHVALVDLVADEATGHRAGRGCGLLAVAAADLVAEQATNHRADHGTADVATSCGVWVVEVSRTGSVPITVA